MWSARDIVIGRHVAVKVLLPHLQSSAAAVLFREARTAGSLNHPGVVTIHDLGHDTDGTFFLVMELVSGRDLGDVLHHQGIPAIAQAAEWGAQIADALAAAHQIDVVHRDLKPTNVMLTDAGTVKVLDFGIAKYLETSSPSSTSVMGTPAYMPPERFRTGYQDARGDLYSLGCLLHELLTGTSPFGHLSGTALMYAHVQHVPDPPSTRRPATPAPLDALVTQLLAKDPEQRPATAVEVSARLRAAVTRAVHSPSGSPSASDQSIMGPWRRAAIYLGLIEDPNWSE